MSHWQIIPPSSLYAAPLIQSIAFQVVLEEIIALGDDTDTMAAISGQIMGSFCGEASLPKYLLQRLPDIAAIESVLAKVTAFAASAGHRET